MPAARRSKIVFLTLASAAFLLQTARLNSQTAKPSAKANAKTEVSETTEDRVESSPWWPTKNVANAAGRVGAPAEWHEVPRRQNRHPSHHSDGARRSRG